MKKGCVLIVSLFISASIVTPAHAGKGKGHVARFERDSQDDFVSTLLDQRSELSELSEENKKLVDTLVNLRLKEDVAQSQAALETISQSQGVLEWDETESLVSFVFVHVAVLLGFAISLVEFLHASRTRKRGRSSDNTEVTLKLESIAIRTTSVGLIILFCSVLFYFLYLKFVYPIQVVPL